MARAALLSALLAAAAWSGTSPAPRQQASRAGAPGSDARATVLAPARVREARPTEGDLADTAALRAFVDSLVTAQMSTYHILGVAIVIVRDGRIELSRGYGIANLDSRTPVDPDSTLFSVGSISKLVTTTAAMQLAEHGTLDLHADVDRYLQGFTLRDPFATPVTMAELLTHTAGFDPRYIGAAARADSAVQPLGTYLAHSLPPIVRPPGQMYVYSNHGMALAGYIVERVSGEPFADYAARHILQPLGMCHSAFAHPPPGTRTLARGYLYRDGRQEPTLDPYLNLVPAGGLFTTATDFSHFLIAQLQGGRYGAARILSDSAMREMQAWHAGYPGLPGAAYGFYEEFYRGERGLRHDGWLPGQGSSVYLLPDRGVGVVLAANSEWVDVLKYRLYTALRERYHPPAAWAPRHTPPKDFARRARRYTGLYRGTEYAMRGMEHAGTLLLSPQLDVVDHFDGMLTVYGRPEGTLELIEIGPDLFERADGFGRVAFVRDAGGHVQRVIFGVDSYYKEPELARGSIIRAIGVVLLILFVTAVVAWGGVELVARRRAPPAADRVARAMIALAAVIAALDIVFVAGMIPAFLWPAAQEIGFGLRPYMIVLLYVPPLSALLTGALLVLGARAWRPRVRWPRFLRAHSMVVTAAAVLYLVILAGMGMLDLRPGAGTRVTGTRITGIIPPSPAPSVAWHAGGVSGACESAAPQSTRRVAALDRSTDARVTPAIPPSSRSARGRPRPQ
ncbi:MAG TPA: serine hydrolase domain-containing protein [Gemmatimonadaceae bacterium]|nr:serine hydrolase domain-containing protein [Gemmatimonadaceae bacterium]